MKYKVRFSVVYEVEIECENVVDLPDKISDLDIPEDEQTKYVEDTFEVEDISPSPIISIPNRQPLA